MTRTTEFSAIYTTPYLRRRAKRDPQSPAEHRGPVAATAAGAVIALELALQELPEVLHVERRTVEHSESPWTPVHGGEAARAEPASAASERWWILRGGFRWKPMRGGELYMGPFLTRDAALDMRRVVERKTGANDLFIEQEPTP